MNESVISKTSEYFKKKGIVLPKISELCNPHTVNKNIINKLKSVDKDAMDPLNLFRVHWFNNRDHIGFSKVPEHVVLPNEFTGVEAKIIVNVGRLFPLIAAHKVLAAYGCLLPRILNGDFDYSKHKTVWPSTGNYCRGGVAISRILGLKSVAILPEGMSKERFDWLDKWVEDPKNDIIDQFTEYYNYSIHRAVTGPSFEKSFLQVKKDSNLNARFYVCASGSSGTLAAGDCLKNSLGTSTAVVEALECPTLLKNGYGEHNIQGIGDKLVPLIHNVMNTDFVVDVSDKATDNLNLLFNTKIGKEYLINKLGLKNSLVNTLPEFGLSSIANIIASIKLAKYMNLGKEDAIITVATDGADLYLSELEKTKNNYQGAFDNAACSNIYKKYLKEIDSDNMLELSQNDKERIFNLGYYTWVEQQGISLSNFEKRKDQQFWLDHYNHMTSLDDRIEKFNAL